MSTRVDTTSSFRRSVACLGLASLLAVLLTPWVVPSQASNSSTVPGFTTSVVAWGGNQFGQRNPPNALTGVRAVAAGLGTSLAVRLDGTVAAWGDNGYGQVDVPTGLDDVVSVASGRRHSVALRADGTVVAWGADDHGQTDVPEGLDNVTAISVRDQHTIALRADGTVVTWAENYTEPIPAGLSDVTAVAAGGGNSVALRSDGTVVAWGSNGGAPWDRVPAGLDDVVSIAAGASHVLALRENGTVVAWGFNDVGQSDVPVGLRDVVAVAAGWTWSLALKSDGTVVSWGTRQYGEPISVPDGLHGVTALSAGGDHVLAIVDRPVCGPWPSVLGRPDLAPGGARGVYLWGDGAGLHLRVTRAFGGRSVFSGQLAASGSFTAVRAVRLEPTDYLRVSADRRWMTFRLSTSGAIDGVDLRLPCSSISMSVTASLGARVLSPSAVHLGANDAHPVSVPFTLWSY